MRKIIPLILAATLFGCATPLIQGISDPQIVNTVQIGTTTQKDMFKLFGRPTYNGIRKSAGEWWGYYYAADDDKPGASLSVDFNSNGVVTNYNYVATADRFHSNVTPVPKDQQMIIYQ